MTVNSRNVNDDRLGPTYHGLETVVTKRYANGFALLAGYTYGKTTVEQTSLASPNAFDQLAGPARRPAPLVQVDGLVHLPVQHHVRRQLAAAVGPADHPHARDSSVHDGGAPTNCLSSQTTINAEPRGSEELPALYTVDLRAGRIFRVNRQTVELSMDVYNLTNANTTYNVQDRHRR